MEQEEFRKKVNEMRIKYNKEHGSRELHMNRVPIATYDTFRKFASNKEFCEDFGFALKFLLDFYYGLIPTGIEHLEIDIESLRHEIELLKQQPQEQKKSRKTLSGKEIGKGE